MAGSKTALKNLDPLHILLVNTVLIPKNWEYSEPDKSFSQIKRVCEGEAKENPYKGGAGSQGVRIAFAQRGQKRDNQSCIDKRRNRDMETLWEMLS